MPGDRELTPAVRKRIEDTIKALILLLDEVGGDVDRELAPDREPIERREPERGE